ncbi:MAG: hypothetical protein DME26_03965 [Verrucomicrobia bacterium]|nr:MAG: hypothetical protein DME26_03965 [Verrucomicrobiota bacterium]
MLGVLNSRITTCDYRSNTDEEGKSLHKLRSSGFCGKCLFPTQTKIGLTAEEIKLVQGAAK